MDRRELVHLLVLAAIVAATVGAVTAVLVVVVDTCARGGA